MMKKTMLVFGHGYTAGALSPRLIAQGWRVIGTTRSTTRRDALTATGVEARIWPGADLSDAIAEASHILISTAPGAGGDPVLAAFGDAIARKTNIDWLGYLSTTAVYGDHGGGRVDEDTPPAPATERGRRRVAAEAAWQDLAQRERLSLHIFRLAGIYGPGRGPLAKVRAGTARRIIKRGQLFSRIHVEDLATVLMASIAHPRPGAIYNVCDNEAAPPEDVIALAAEFLGQPVPEAEPFVSAEMSAMARSFYAESKRVDNRLIREELGVELAFPTYREGLRSLIAEEGESQGR